MVLPHSLRDSREAYPLEMTIHIPLPGTKLGLGEAGSLALSTFIPLSPNSSNPRDSKQVGAGPGSRVTARLGQSVHPLSASTTSLPILRHKMVGKLGLKGQEIRTQDAG